MQSQIISIGNVNKRSGYDFCAVTGHTESGPGSLHHVSLEIAPADGERFAELLDAIGFDPIDSPEALGGSVRWFDGAGTQVHLILTKGATAPALGHAAFAVTPFAQTLDALRQRGF